LVCITAEEEATKRDEELLTSETSVHIRF